jgi:group I intron endonuclease
MPCTHARDDGGIDHGEYEMKKPSEIHTRHLAGVYLITNEVNDKFYIGSSIDLLKRFHQHRWQLRNACHPNRHLQAAWNKYDEASFVFSVLKFCDSKDVIAEEQLAMDNLKPEYNHRKIADSNTGLIGINAEIDDETVKTLIVTYMAHPEMTLKELGAQFGDISESYVQQLVSGQDRSYIVLDDPELQNKLDQIRTMAGFRNTAMRGASKLNPDCILVIKELLKTLSVADIANHYDVHPEAIRRIKRGESWQVVNNIDQTLYDYIRSPECRYEVENESAIFNSPVTLSYGFERMMVLHCKLYHLEDAIRNPNLTDIQRSEMKTKIDQLNGIYRPMLIAGLSQLWVQAMKTQDATIIAEHSTKKYGNNS